MKHSYFGSIKKVIAENRNNTLISTIAILVPGTVPVIYFVDFITYVSNKESNQIEQGVNFADL